MQSKEVVTVVTTVKTQLGDVNNPEKSNQFASHMATLDGIQTKTTDLQKDQKILCTLD